MTIAKSFSTLFRCNSSKIIGQKIAYSNGNFISVEERLKICEQRLAIAQSQLDNNKSLIDEYKNHLSDLKRELNEKKELFGKLIEKEKEIVCIVTGNTKSQLSDKNELIQKYRKENRSMDLEILFLNNMLNARGVVELFERQYFGTSAGKNRTQKWNLLDEEDEFVKTLREKHGLSKDVLVSTVSEMYRRLSSKIHSTAESKSRVIFHKTALTDPEMALLTEMCKFLRIPYSINETNSLDSFLSGDDDVAEYN